jgi:hypothetical protein
MHLIVVILDFPILSAEANLHPCKADPEPMISSHFEGNISGLLAHDQNG